MKEKSWIISHKYGSRNTMHTQTYRYGNEAFCYVLLLAHKSINSALLL